MLQVTADGSTFVLHARTAKMELVTGTQVNATVFTAFGAENNKDGGKVFVEMSRTKTGMCVCMCVRVCACVCMARMDVGGLGCVWG